MGVVVDVRATAPAKPPPESASAAFIDLDADIGAVDIERFLAGVFDAAGLSQFPNCPGDGRRRCRGGCRIGGRSSR